MDTYKIKKLTKRQIEDFWSNKPAGPENFSYKTLKERFRRISRFYARHDGIHQSCPILVCHPDKEQEMRQKLIEIGLIKKDN